MMNNMGGEDDLPDLDGADDVRGFFFLLSFISSLSIRCALITKEASDLA